MTTQTPPSEPARVALRPLETPRLILRAHRASDADAVFAMRTHPEGTRFLSMHPPTSVGEVEERLRSVIARVDAQEMYGWSITVRGDDRCVGLLGLVRIDRTHRHAEIAYELTFAEWGKGIVREAVARLVTFSFDELGLHRLEIRTDPANARSANVAKGLGFAFDGRLREDERRPDGTYCDSLVFSRLATD